MEKLNKKIITCTSIFLIIIVTLLSFISVILVKDWKIGITLYFLLIFCLYNMIENVKIKKQMVESLNILKNISESANKAVSEIEKKYYNKKEDREERRETVN